MWCKTNKINTYLDKFCVYNGCLEILLNKNGNLSFGYLRDFINRNESKIYRYDICIPKDNIKYIDTNTVNKIRCFLDDCLEIKI